MHRLTEKEQALLDTLYFDVSFLTYGETKEALTELCQKQGLGLVEEIGSQYNAFLIELTLPRINASSVAVKGILEWQRNKGNPFLCLTWADDTTEAYLSSKREKKAIYEKLFQKITGILLTEFSLLY